MRVPSQQKKMQMRDVARRDTSEVWLLLTKTQDQLRCHTELGSPAQTGHALSESPAAATFRCASLFLRSSRSGELCSCSACSTGGAPARHKCCSVSASASDKLSHQPNSWFSESGTSYSVGSQFCSYSLHYSVNRPSAENSIHLGVSSENTMTEHQSHQVCCSRSFRWCR